MPHVFTLYELHKLWVMWSKSISCNPVEAKILFGQRVWDIDSSFIEELKVSSRAKAEVKSVWNLLLNIQHQQFLTTILVEIDRPTTFWSCCKIRGWKVLNLAHRQTQPPCTSSLLGRRSSPGHLLMGNRKAAPAGKCSWNWNCRHLRSSHNCSHNPVWGLTSVTLQS